MPMETVATTPTAAPAWAAASTRPSEATPAQATARTKGPRSGRGAQACELAPVAAPPPHGRGQAPGEGSGTIFSSPCGAVRDDHDSGCRGSNEDRDADKGTDGYGNGHQGPNVHANDHYGDVGSDGRNGKGPANGLRSGHTEGPRG